jgi:heme A synthase
MTERIGDIVATVIGLIFALFIGIILMWALYPTNPFLAVVGVILVIAMVISAMVGIFRGKSS